MNKGDILDFNLENCFSESNNIVVKAMSRKRNMQGSSMKYYLASKTENGINFYDGLEVLFDDAYKYDDNLNLQILNDDNKIVQEIKKEKFFSLKENDYCFEQVNEDFNVFIKLPLSRPISFNQLKIKHSNPTIIFEGQVKDQSIKELLEKQEQAIHYDANQMYNKYLEAVIERE